MSEPHGSKYRIVYHPERSWFRWVVRLTAGRRAGYMVFEAPGEAACREWIDTVTGGAEIAGMALDCGIAWKPRRI